MRSSSCFCWEVLLIAKKKKKESPQFSPYISGVCKMMEDAVKDYIWSRKDTAEILEPLVQFLDSDKGKNMMNLLREALGRTRKAEERMGNRVYHPRVLTEDAS